jgi:hypothetical protein
MKILFIRYPKTKDDLDNLEYLNRNYHALLEGSVKAENKLIKLPVPSDFAN